MSAYNLPDKVTAQHIDHPEDASRCSLNLVVPELVRNMTPEYRLRLETQLKRKIDLRLLPMIILMYMNYLDRNNIAAARLVGLQADLNLTSVQFNVRPHFIKYYFPNDWI